MTKAAIRTNPSFRFRDVVAYAALALCAGLGLLVILFGEGVNRLFGQ